MVLEQAIEKNHYLEIFSLKKTMNTEITIDQSTVYQASYNHLYSEIADEAVILDMDSGVYYGLNSVGVDIWQWLQQPKTEVQILDRLLAEYDIDRDQASEDIQSILKDMLEVSLITIVES